MGRSPTHPPTPKATHTKGRAVHWNVIEPAQLVWTYLVGSGQWKVPPRGGGGFILQT